MKHKWIVIVIPVLILAAAITLFYPKKNKNIPASLMGKWTTSAPGYQDRFIDFTKETLVFGIGNNKKDVYTITSLEKKLEEKNIIYTINFKNSEVKFARSFYYYPEKGGSIQFKHQKQITWRREADTETQ